MCTLGSKQPTISLNHQILALCSHMKSSEHWYSAFLLNADAGFRLSIGVKRLSAERCFCSNGSEMYTEKSLFQLKGTCAQSIVDPALQASAFSAI